MTGGEVAGARVTDSVTGGDVVPGFLLAWAGLPGPTKLLRVVRARLEAGRLGPRSGVEVGLSSAERRQVEQLLNVGWAQSGEPVPMRALRRGLQQNGASLEALLAAVGGPLRDLPQLRRQRRDELDAGRLAALAQLRALLGVPASDELAAEVDAALLRWVVRRRPPLERAAEVAAAVAALPADGEAELLPVLAARIAQDAHALDRSRPLGRAVARFLVIRAAVAETAGSAATDGSGLFLAWQDPVAGSEGWRQAWASGGVACDTVSSQVLVLNLPLVGDAPAVRLCGAATGEPVWLTLRSLVGSLALAAPTRVFVCENPSILEAAAHRLGDRCAPLVCTFGRPSLAALRLLDAVAPDAHLRLRADGDAAGWAIVDHLAQRYPAAQRWRMPDGFAQFEEQLLDSLIEDLGSSGPGAPPVPPTARDNRT
ncbi:MAG TPA: TIGR02679 domain-containing protein [Propionicimonas sp.]|nr:TIGR02679 domain-containing protein [Propionicimonas sp.]